MQLQRVTQLYNSTLDPDTKIESAAVRQLELLHTANEAGESPSIHLSL